MAQPEFLLRFRWKKPPLTFQAAELKVEHPEVMRTTYTNLGGFRFGHSTGIGKFDRTKLDIRSPQISSYVFRVAATADGVKAVLRRLRSDEAADLDLIDAEIEDLQAQLAALKERRKQVIELAWHKAHVVRLIEVERVLSRPIRFPPKLTA